MRDFYRSVLRRLLFYLPPAQAHRLAMALLGRPWLWAWTGSRYLVPDPRLRVEAGGLKLMNPVGLAAGIDKDCEIISALSRFGFGYMVAGSVMERPSTGNPQPVFKRMVPEESLLNCMGLPSKGVQYCSGRLLKEAARRHKKPGPRSLIVVNISGSQVEELVRAYEVIQLGVDAVEVTLLCPNVKYREETFLEAGKLEELLRELMARKTCPLFIKIRNYDTDEERENRLELASLCMRYAVDGLTLPGSKSVDDTGLSIGRGNLSGRRIYPICLRNVRDLYEATGGNLSIKALGGISTGFEAFQAIAAGASTVELLTSFIYQGPGIARRINQELLALLDREGVASVRDLRGRGSL